MTIREQAMEAAAAARLLAAVSPVIKNSALEAMADALLAEQAEILAANVRDMEAGRAKNMKNPKTAAGLAAMAVLVIGIGIALSMTLCYEGFHIPDYLNMISVILKYENEQANALKLT